MELLTSKRMRKCLNSTFLSIELLIFTFSKRFSPLYGTVYDMLTTIIHASLAHDPNERDENKKHFVNLVKKVRNCIGDKASRTKQSVRQLLPIVRMPRHIIAVESNERSSQYPGIDLIDRVPGLRATEKQKVNTWDLIEGNSKNPAPLSFAWFGAVKMERRPMKYEKGFELLKYHTHNLAKPRTYYYEPLTIPAKETPPPQSLRTDDATLNMNMNNMPGTIMAPVPMVSSSFQHGSTHALMPIYLKDIPKIETPSSIEQSPSIPIVPPQISIPPQQGKRTKKTTKAAAAAAAAVAAAAQLQVMIIFLIISFPDLLIEPALLS